MPDGWSVFELRQYTLRPGQRDRLIELFDRELVESQEATGAWIVGQFRDLDRADRFVWVRGFRDMASRLTALTDFYSGPVWRRHAPAANATMLDVDDVLLLRPLPGAAGFAVPDRPRSAATAPPPASLVTATLYHRDRPVEARFAEFFRYRVEPVLVGAGARPLACLQIEPAENTFPALPVRTGEHVLVWFSGFGCAAHHRAHTERLDRSSRWRDEILPELLGQLSRPPELLRLAPTARSQLR
jgi:NIPSNAP